MKTNSIMLRALCVTALAAALLSSKAQGDITIEHRHQTACAPTYLFNQTGQEYVHWIDTIRFENGVVEERPAFTYAVDTDGDKELDTWSDSPEVCEEAEREARDCQALPYGDESLIFEDQSGQDNVRMKSKKPDEL